MHGVKVRLGDLPAREPIPGVVARRLMGEKAMVQEVRLAAGAGAPRHAHANEQIVIVLSGRISIAAGEAEAVILGPGEAMVLPGGMAHLATAVEACVLLDIFAPPSETTGIDAPAGG